MTNLGGDRLDRIEALLFQVAQQQEVNTAVIALNAEAITDLRTASEALLQTVNQHQENFEVLVQEIRGLRTENRRILDHLFGQEEL